MRHIKVHDKLVQKSDMFKVDLTPTPSQENSYSNRNSTPTYRKTFSKVLLSGEEAQLSEKSKDSALLMCRPKAICFNCGKDNHQIRDCPEKKDMRKIKLAREEFGKKNERYHEEIDNKLVELTKKSE